MDCLAGRAGSVPGYRHRMKLRPCRWARRPSWRLCSGTPASTFPGHVVARPGGQRRGREGGACGQLNGHDQHIDEQDRRHPGQRGRPCGVRTGSWRLQGPLPHGGEARTQLRLRSQVPGRTAGIEVQRDPGQGADGLDIDILRGPRGALWGGSNQNISFRKISAETPVKVMLKPRF